MVMKKESSNSKNLLILLTIVVIGWCVVVIYGILYYEFSYNISPDYYTKMAFEHYGFCESPPCRLESPRMAVAEIGFDASWIMAIVTSVSLGLLALILKVPRLIMRNSIRALFRMILVMVITGLIGVSSGYIYTDVESSYIWTPENMENPKEFLAVVTMHSYTQIGAIVGLLFAGAFLVRKRKKLHKDNDEYPLFAGDEES